MFVQVGNPFTDPETSYIRISREKTRGGSCEQPPPRYFEEFCSEINNVTFGSKVDSQMAESVGPRSSRKRYRNSFGTLSAKTLNANASLLPHFRSKMPCFDSRNDQSCDRNLIRQTARFSAQLHPLAAECGRWYELFTSSICMYDLLYQLRPQRNVSRHQKARQADGVGVGNPAPKAIAPLPSSDCRSMLIYGFIGTACPLFLQNALSPKCALRLGLNFVGN